MSEEIDIQKYTYDEAYKTFIAIENHLAIFDNKPMFCKSCLFKHLKYLLILSQECLAANCGYNFGGIEKWSNELLEKLNHLAKPMVEEAMIKARDFRKELEGLLFQPSEHLKSEV